MTDDERFYHDAILGAFDAPESFFKLYTPTYELANIWDFITGDDHAFLLSIGIAWEWRAVKK